jgi:hypothetical protein
MIKTYQVTRLAAIAALSGSLMATSASKLMAANQCKIKQLELLAPQNGSSISGGGVLVVNKNGANVLMQADNLTPGVAYTVWFAYVDKTANCLTPNQCVPADLFMPAGNPAGVFGRMDAGIAGPNGELTFQATLRDFEVSPGSAVHLILFTHGPVSTTDLQERARQLLTPENPALGAPGLGVGTEKGFLVGFIKFDIDSCK